MDDLDAARRQKLIVALLTERDNAAAFAAAGIPARTAYRWMKTRAFQAEMAAAAQSALAHGNGLLRTAYADAVRTLKELMRASDSELIRLRAAATIVANANSKTVQDPADAEHFAGVIFDAIKQAPKEVRDYFKNVLEDGQGA